MAIFYDEVNVYPNGILTVQEFTPPINGRRVKFVLPKGYSQKQVFTCIDGKYDGPFNTVAPLESEIRGFELLRTGAHSATVIVINTGESPLNPVSLRFNSAVTLSSGEIMPLELVGTINATVRVSDVKSLLLDHLENGVNSVEKTIESILANCVKKEINNLLREYASSLSELNRLGGFDYFSDQIIESACKSAHCYLNHNWFEIKSCSLDLKAMNWNKIIERENYLWIKAETRDDNEYKLKNKLIEMTYEALLKTYGQQPISNEMINLLVTYVQNNPNIQANELLSVTNEFKKLSQVYSFDQLQKYLPFLGLPNESS